jgi:serine protease inhibitor ecotin
MKFLLASIVIACLAATASAQTAEKPAPSKKAVPVKKVPPATKRQAIEEATPTEEPDPAIKLSAAELDIAKRVYVGDIQCELGAKVSVKPMKRDGFFFVSRGVNKFVMHPVESRTGAIRLEDPARGALWLQLGNKSMLMNQKEGKRLADECQSPEQVQFAQEMKNRPPVNLLDSAPAGSTSVR